jgi:hypothetical protein
MLGKFLEMTTPTKARNFFRKAQVPKCAMKIAENDDFTELFVAAQSSCIAALVAIAVVRNK